uniref:Eukaryotic translation initiation factor 3 subunit I n=1 Tax=Strigamia maritima TaxID=126957 RepID=T1IKC0_STRMM
MKPLMLHGHERSITQIRYSREGDLLFSCSKDSAPTVWYSLNGERLGTFLGHTGAVWCIDVNWDTTKVVSGSADNSLILWDCETGRQLSKIITKSAVRTCNFSYSGRQLCFTTDKQMGQLCELHVIDIANMAGEEHINEMSCRQTISMSETKVTSCMWGPVDEYFITGHENGEIAQFDLKTSEKMKSVREHSLAINDLQFNKDQTMFISASKDHTARLYDTESLEVMKVYKTERPVNSAAISPIRDHVVLGGGQEAMDVTTTSARIGKFDARFYHLVFEEEFGRIKGHFGPINTVMFHPDGKSYSSGGEDGYIRIHNFDPQYFDFQMEQ